MGPPPAGGGVRGAGASRPQQERSRAPPPPSLPMAAIRSGQTSGWGGMVTGAAPAAGAVAAPWPWRRTAFWPWGGKCGWCRLLVVMGSFPRARMTQSCWVLEAWVSTGLQLLATTWVWVLLGESPSSSGVSWARGPHAGCGSASCPQASGSVLCHHCTSVGFTRCLLPLGQGVLGSLRDLGGLQPGCCLPTRTLFLPIFSFHYFHLNTPSHV